MSENYLKYYYGVDPLWQSAISTPAGTVQTDTMLIPRRELVRTEFFNDFLIPQSIDGLLNAIVLVEDGRQSVVTLHGDQQFDEGHVALYKLLVPHMQRAVQINIKLARAALNHIASVETPQSSGRRGFICRFECEHHVCEQSRGEVLYRSRSTTK